jgi:hypothetical protein
MKMKITGASNWVNRMFEACGPFQWAREFLKNSREADATRIEFGIEWQAVVKADAYRRTIADNGVGMDTDDLMKFFSTLGAGAKKIAGVHDNFGVGAKIAALPWNPLGMVVISYKNGVGSMIWIVLDEDTQEYDLLEFEGPSGRLVVTDPSLVDDEDVKWGDVAPDWVREHGTIIVLLGSKEYPDTIMGNPHAGEDDIKGLSVFLNTRFWDLTDCEVTVVEPRQNKKTMWPQGPEDKDDARRANNRRIYGAKYYITDPDAKWKSAGSPKHSGTVLVDQERVPVEWHLWEGERPMVHSYAKRGGYIAIRYRGELYEVTSHKTHFRGFGVVESKVQTNLTIVLEPPLYTAGNGRWGVYPDQSRNRLLFTGKGEKGVAIPIFDWGVEFAATMPEPVLEAIRAARGDATGGIEDEDYRKRLQDKFGDRWRSTVRVKGKAKKQGDQGGTADGGEADVTGAPDDLTGTGAGSGTSAERKKKMVRRRLLRPGGSEEMVEKQTPVDVPRFRMARKDEFENPLHLAMWAPTEPGGPFVVINQESPILEEVIAYHQEQYPDVYAEEIVDTVRKVYGEIAACKIAHSQKLGRLIPKEELDLEYRSEKALTVALMGLMAEDTIIAQRLGKLGAKKKTA